MSYERRLEIEALPAEEGWGKWQGVIGHGTELVERKQLAPLTIWVAGANGPMAVEAYRYEKWCFSDNGKPVDKRRFSYTHWLNNYDYIDYSLTTDRLNSLCAETREELCEKARALLDKELKVLYQSVARKEATREKY